MDPISGRPAMDEGERTLRRIARVGVVLALCWAAGGVYLASVLELQDVLAWVVWMVAFAPLYLLYAVAGEVLGARRVRRAMNAMWTWVPPVLYRHVVGSALLLLVVTVAGCGAPGRSTQSLAAARRECCVRGSAVSPFTHPGDVIRSPVLRARLHGRREP